MPSLIALALLHFYKAALSPWLPSACRFRPTCSEYMMDAIRQHGLLPGGLNTRELDGSLAVDYLLKNRASTVKHVLSNSFGFGGTNCSLIFGLAA